MGAAELRPLGLILPSAGYHHICLPCATAGTDKLLATLECELLERRRFASQPEAKIACFSFIEGWYNPARLHSALGYRSPMTYEAAMEAVTTEP